MKSFCFNTAFDFWLKVPISITMKNEFTIPRTKEQNQRNHINPSLELDIQNRIS